jgi:hypothetical protein
MESPVSFSYRACFLLSQSPDADRLRAFFRSQELDFVLSAQCIAVQGDKLVEQSCPVFDWPVFAADMASAMPSAYGHFESTASEEDEEVYFDLGFSIVAGTRIAWIELSERNLARLGFALYDRDSDPLRFWSGCFARSVPARW